MRVPGGRDRSEPCSTRSHSTKRNLLTNYDSTKNRLYLEWIRGRGTLHPVKLASPADYDEIFRVVDAELASVVTVPRSDGVELCFHLSPGSPAMAAVWVLLGKKQVAAP